MAAENIMERSHPEASHFTSPEERENIEFYQGWVETAFTGELYGVATMAKLRDSLTLSRDDIEAVRFYGIDLSSVQIALAEIEQKIHEEVHDAAADIQHNVFDNGLFSVKIYTLGKKIVVEGVSPHGERVVPVVDGEPYLGFIDGLEFGR